MINSGYKQEVFQMSDIDFEIVFLNLENNFIDYKIVSGANTITLGDADSKTFSQEAKSEQEKF